MVHQGNLAAASNWEVVFDLPDPPDLTDRLSEISPSSRSDKFESIRSSKKAT